MDGAEPDNKTPKQLPAPAVQHPADLPSCYGTTHLILLEIDPSLAHAFWEMTPEDVRRAADQAGASVPAAWTLRIYDIASESPCLDLTVDPAARNWYIHLPFKDRAYFAEIGLRTADRFLAVCRSDPAGWQGGAQSGNQAPRKHDSDERVAAHVLVLPAEGEVSPTGISAGKDSDNSRSAIRNPQTQEPACSYASGLPASDKLKQA